LYSSVRGKFPELERFGFALHEGASGDRWLEISAIRILERARGKSVGTGILGMVVSHADRNGWMLTVTPDARFSGPGGGGKTAQRKLEQWYRSFGFVPNSGRRRDYEVYETWLRKPVP
jgi:GNAT superfamily N-acetyltransferase